MSQENVQIVQRGFEQYFATGEPPWDVYDEGIEVYDHDTPDQGVYRGHAGVARWLEDWGAAWAEWSIDLEQLIDAGDSVVVFIRMRTTGLGSGIQTDREDAQVLRLRDAQVVRLDYFNDRRQALKAVGLEEE
jgi:ketosteroid isomerase-like protein